MTKSELIDKLHESDAASGVSKKSVGEMVDGLFDLLAETIKKDGRFSYPGFGTFTLKRRGSRVGRNPRTGEELKIAASKTVTFKPAPTLKERL